MMIYLGNGKSKLEKYEPDLRSCWECNGAHIHLKKMNTLLCCLECGEYYIFGKKMSSFKNNKQFDDFFEKKHGMKKGQSTTKIDLGYRIWVLEVKPKEKK
jgi:hypothetical protein